MKKLFFIAIAAILIIPFTLTTNAEVDSPSITVFESIENLLNLDGFRINQNINGNFIFKEVGPDIEEIRGEYKLIVSTKIFNKNAFESDSDSTVTGNITIHANGENTPFDNMVINFRGQLRQITDDGVYFKLNFANLNATGVPADEIESYNDFKSSMQAKVKEIQRIWYFVPKDKLESSFSSEVPYEFGGLLGEETVQGSFKEEGVEQTYKKALSNTPTSLFEQGLIPMDLEEPLMQVVDEFFNTKVFAIRTIKTSNFKGFTNYTLSKRRLERFIESAAAKFGESLTESEMSYVKSFLNKFYLSGMYKVNKQHGIFDHFRFRLTLRNIELLKHFQFNYSFKVSQINEVDPITGPSDFTDAEVLGGMF